jgi:hypothetical protein
MGTWSTINVPNSASGSYNADLMILLTDGSVLIHNADESIVPTARSIRPSGTPTGRGRPQATRRRFRRLR